MNVLKVFNKQFDASFAQENFVLDNFHSIDSVDKWGRVKLLHGHRIHFFVLNTIEDAQYRISGECYSWVEYKGCFDPDVKQWIASRIREAPSK